MGSQLEGEEKHIASAVESQFDGEGENTASAVGSQLEGEEEHIASAVGSQQEGEGRTLLVLWGVSWRGSWKWRVDAAPNIQECTLKV